MSHCFYLLKIPISDVEHPGNDKLSEENRILRKVDLRITRYKRANL